MVEIIRHTVLIAPVVTAAVVKAADTAAMAAAVVAEATAVVEIVWVNSEAV